MGNEEKHISFLENFISKYYMKQPQWLRTFVYLVFALLLVFTLYRFTCGDYFVQGRVFVKTPTGRDLTSDYEIDIRDKSFGTNSDGVYYVILSPTQYYRLLVKGKMDMLAIKSGDVREVTVGYKRLDRVFEDIVMEKVVPDTTMEEMGWLDHRYENAFSPLDLIIPAAWAGRQKPELGGDRIFVTAVIMTSKVDVPREGEFVSEIGGQIVELLSVRSGGWQAGPVPLVQGERVGLEQEYFFSAPERFNGEPTAFIIIRHSGGLFGRYEETFPVDLIHPFGKTFRVEGDKGSVIELKRMSAYNVVIWEKRDISEALETLAMELTEKGFQINVQTSKLGYNAQTNALFGGKSVPHTILQTVLERLNARGVHMKRIEYKRELKSGDDYAIQIGGHKAYDDKPVIPPETMELLIGAGTEDEFREILSSLD